VTSPLELLLEPLSYPFMVRALVTALVAATVCAVLSCWITLIGWSLMGDAVSHAVLPGVVLAHLVGAPFTLGAVLFGFLAVLLIGFVRDTSRVKEDAAIGIVFTALFALGLVLVSVVPSQTDLVHIVFGNLLGIGRGEVLQVVAVGAIVLAVLVGKRRDLTLLAFDRVHAHAIGLNPRLLGTVLIGLLALTSVVALQAVGVVLVVALLITPGATAYLLTDRMSRMLLIAPALAAVCAVAGLYASYYLDTAPGPTIVLAQALVFAVVHLFGPRRGVLSTQWRRRPARPARTGRTAHSSGAPELDQPAVKGG
jgi:manganese transport system permease protein